MNPELRSRAEVMLRQSLATHRSKRTALPNKTRIEFSQSEGKAARERIADEELERLEDLRQGKGHMYTYLHSY